MNNQTLSERFNVNFTPVVNTTNGEVITSAWDFITMVSNLDKPYLTVDVNTLQPKGYKHPRYQVIHRNELYVVRVLAESLNSYEDAVSIAVEKAWEVVSDDLSCKYGIWQDERQLKALIEDALCPEDASHWLEMLGRLEAKGGAK